MYCYSQDKVETSLRVADFNNSEEHPICLTSISEAELVSPSILTSRDCRADSRSSIAALVVSIWGSDWDTLLMWYYISVNVRRDSDKPLMCIIWILRSVCELEQIIVRKTISKATPKVFFVVIHYICVFFYTQVRSSCNMIVHLKAKINTIKHHYKMYYLNSFAVVKVTFLCPFTILTYI